LNIRLTQFFRACLLVGSYLFLTCHAQAQSDSDHTKKYNPTSEPYQLLWNASIVSDYRSKGLDQTFGLPAFQFELGTLLPNNFYIGTWNSNVSTGAGYPGTFLETDFFGGWTHEINDYHINTGLYGVVFPGSNVANYITSPVEPGMSSGLVHNGDVFLAVRKGPVTVQQNITFTNAGNMLSPTGQSTAGSAYTNLLGVFPVRSWNWLDGEWSVVAHTGYQFINNYSAASYFDWKFGIQTKLDKAWTIDLLYIQTNARGNCSTAATTAQPYCYNKYQYANGTVSGPSKNGGDAAIVLMIKVANF
jgi:uncharacterized protein (TIGR02001 family)